MIICLVGTGRHSGNFADFTFVRAEWVPRCATSIHLMAQTGQLLYVYVPYDSSRTWNLSFVLNKPTVPVKIELQNTIIVEYRHYKTPFANLLSFENFGFYFLSVGGTVWPSFQTHLTPVKKKIHRHRKHRISISATIDIFKHRTIDAPLSISHHF